MGRNATQGDSAGAGLKERWTAMTGAEGVSLRQRDAARKLGVSEAELVACRCGDGVQRLRGPWGALLQDLHRLGTVMALTRNDSVVHEKVGCYGNVTVYQNTAIVLNEDIDLRIFLGHWHHGYAVTEETPAGMRRSLQFYDVDGTAVHKVYPREDNGALDALVEDHLHADQTPGQPVLPPARRAPDRPDTEIDREGLRRRWQTSTECSRRPAPGASRRSGWWARTWPSRSSRTASGPCSRTRPWRRFPSWSSPEARA